MNIEKNIPVPENAGSRSGAKKYPFVDMLVGDSVLVEGVRSTEFSREYTAARVHGHKTGKRFCARKVDGGVRIWRIE